MQISWITIWELLAERAEKNLNLNVKHANAHRTEIGKKAMTNMQEFAMKPEASAKEGTDVDGGHMAAARAGTIQQVRNSYSLRCIFMHKSETGKTLTNFCRTKSFAAAGRKHNAQKFNDLGGTFPCMRCGKRSKHANISGTFQGVRWMDKA